MYNNYQYMGNVRNFNTVRRPNDNRFVGGGFLGPFILGGITGGLLAPSFYPRPYPVYPPVYGPYPPVYGPFPPVYGPY